MHLILRSLPFIEVDWRSKLFICHQGSWALLSEENKPLFPYLQQLSTLRGIPFFNKNISSYDKESMT